MKTYKIKIKYCGGCNPEIERGNVVKKFRELVAESPFKNKILFDEGNDILIKINGCPHACLDEEVELDKHCRHTISVKGKTIDYTLFEEKNLPGALFDKIKEIIQ